MITAEILEIRPAIAPDVVRPRPAPENRAGAGLVRLFGLDRLPARHQLVRRWRRDRDSRLAAYWEPDVAPSSQP